jgi:myo-inositol-hexaphosphate 3-phosphohydrolase
MSTEVIDQIRFAQFNASLNRTAEGRLTTDLANPNADTPGTRQAKAVAEIIQRNNPDVVLINEFDYDAANPEQSVKLFLQNYLGQGQNGAGPVEYPYFYIAPSNTGIPSGFDLDNNGAVVSSVGAAGYGNDAFGFGNYPGQYGMVLLSKYPIDTANVRTFQNFLWKDMPDALLSTIQTPGAAEPWYSSAEQSALRLSSKSHWDVPIQVNGKTIHALVSHPTPPVFDGPEDRNGKRNHDEIRFWSDYVTPGKGGYIYDDQGRKGALDAGSSFVIMGDQNADPLDGDSFDQAISQLLDNPNINTSVTPSSAGAVEAAQRQHNINDQHQGNPAFDTADFSDVTPGNLRSDYVLPSQNLKITDAEVFWPTQADDLFRLIGEFDRDFPPEGFPSSDHKLVSVDVQPITDASRKTVTGTDFLGQITFPTGTELNDTEIGGLSGITYDASKQLYYSISDDRSEKNPARFYTLKIDLSDGQLDDGDIKFETVTSIKNQSGNLFSERSVDPEGIAITQDGKLYISSEGDANRLINPFINAFSLNGQEQAELPIPENFLPTADQSQGIRNNLAFESLAITPDQRYLYSATENALYQDGPAVSLTEGSPSRIIRYDLKTGQVDKEILYEVGEVPVDSNPPGNATDNGLVELIALDNNGTLLALERAFAPGVGNTLRLYEVQVQNTTDVKDIAALKGLEVDAVAQKRLLLDFSTLNISLDNFEGMTLGPVLPDGRRSLIVVSDNNFSNAQATKFLAFALDTQTVPAVSPVTETPSLIRTEDGSDADDPAIYVNPLNPDQSLVITALKDGGLAVYDLDGQEIQRINPGEIRFNNVDLVYGFKLGGQSVDLAIASDRRNDTLAIWAIDPATQKLTNITAKALSDQAASIFGIDNGSETAYGLATYISPVTGKPYVFVSQRAGDKIAQLELIDNGQGQIDAKLIRTLTVPIPADSELEDAQVEGMVADRELGYLYAAQEQVGIWKFQAEPSANPAGKLIQPVKPDGEAITADAEGLTIYYEADGKGYLLASSQGDSSYAAFSRQGNNDYLGSFVIDDGIDGVEESDGADVTSAALGSKFPNGLLVVHDGSNEPAVVVEDEGEVQNFNTNFKYISWDSVAKVFKPALNIDPSSSDPRQPQPNSLLGVASGDTNQTSTVHVDSLVNDKDDFIKQIVDGGLNDLGYDPVGLNLNLSQADGLIKANLLKGDYVATHTYGWTEFDINPQTQKLLVTTYGIPSYSEAQLANPSAITGLTPTVVSQFEVLPV